LSARLIELQGAKVMLALTERHPDLGGVDPIQQEIMDDPSNVSTKKKKDNSDQFDKIIQIFNKIYAITAWT
jgi:hypothetical protein